MVSSNIPATLSNLQLELLRLYAKNISEPELEDIRRLLARYFMQKSITEATKIWEQKGYDEQTLLNEPS